MSTNLTLETTSSGYINQLFSILKNNPNFCLQEKNTVNAYYVVEKI